jgi:hypothetical protein
MSGDFRKSNLHNDLPFQSAAEEGTYCAHEYVIVAAQKDHGGNLTYRTGLAEDAEGLGEVEEDLGRIALLDEEEFVDDEKGESGC